MIILGIDPGLRQTGWGVIELDYDSSGVVLRDFDYKAPHSFGGIQKVNPTRKYLESGTIKTNPKENLPNRLETLRGETEAVVNDIKPDLVVVETTFFSRHTPTVLLLAQARGAICSALWTVNEYKELSPSQIKAQVGFSGRTDKELLWECTQKFITGIPDKKMTPDEKDALAIALAGVL